MSNELEDLAERVDHLERIVNSLEERLDMTAMRLQIVSDGRTPRRPANASGQEAGRPGGGVSLEQIDARLRSVILTQGQHNSQIRSVARNLQILVERKFSGGRS